MKKFWMFLLVFIFCSCDEPVARKITNPPGTETSYLIFGVYCGHCLGHCATMYKVDDIALYTDSTDSFFKNSGDILFPAAGTSGTKFTDAQNLMTKIPSELFTSDSTRFGIPDAYDQCGFYVEILKDGTTKKFYIDTNPAAIPAYLAAFTQEIRNTIAKLN